MIIETQLHKNSHCEAKFAHMFKGENVPGRSIFRRENFARLGRAQNEFLRGKIIRNTQRGNFTKQFLDMARHLWQRIKI